ncbi:type II and III secretion system protein [Dechloromonas sp. ZY10]|uniref:type II secretion system protein GspD n=1 Tax=Dechloromonas aquae TaxID=2664436 RepID=UPI00352973D1
MFKPALLITLILCCQACAPQYGASSGRGHLTPAAETAPSTPGIPPLLRESLELPPLRTKQEQLRLSITVNNQNLPELLLALARDARLNLDLHPAISGKVSLHAVDQPLPLILERLARQHELRFEFSENTLSVLPDSPYLAYYQVDYPNLSRSANTLVGSSAQIAGGPPTLPATTPLPGAAPSSNNLSSSRIENSSRHQFWENLERNLKDILREHDQPLPDGSSETQVEQQQVQQNNGPHFPPRPASRQRSPGPQQNAPAFSDSQSSSNLRVRRSTVREAAAIIVHQESGVIGVRANQRQHDKIREFIQRVLLAARRQVLIEATVVEVALHDGYEQGIDWSRLGAGGLFEFLGNPLRTGVNLKFTRNEHPEALLSLLASFGQTRVLSSPRLSVLNNQSALLKVVENYVYFTVKADAIATANVGTTTTYTTTPQTIPVGLTLAVTPQIAEDGQIILNIRPTITSIGREVPDPNPDLRKNGIENLVPVIRTREIESIMRIDSGQIAVLGGLMEDASDERNKRIPGLGELPAIGEIFTNRQQQRRKTELVVFLRPLLIRQASLLGDYRDWREHLPSQPKKGTVP